MKPLRDVALLAWVLLAARGPAQSPSTDLERVLAGGTPHSRHELRAMERHVRALTQRARLSLVSIGGASGVLVGNGIVLTAAHVTARPGRRLRVTLHDGRRVVGVTLGLNTHTDAALIRLRSIDVDRLVSLPLGHSAGLVRGQWCAMLGFPGGRKRGLEAPLRLGRFQRVSRSGYLVTDCLMSSGDSGGPLLDMQGRVIGVHSRIAMDLATNLHVPVDLVRRDFARMLRGEVLGTTSDRAVAYLGVRVEMVDGSAHIREVLANTAAARAGMRVGDVVSRFASHDVDARAMLPELVRSRRPGERIKIEIVRAGKVRELHVRLGRMSRR